MRGKRRLALGIVLAGLSVLCWFKAFWTINPWVDGDLAYHLTFRHPQTLSESNWEALKQEEVSWVLVQERAATVTAHQFERRESVILMEAAGSLSRLLPSFQVKPAAASITTRECVIDMGSGYALWGDGQIIGKYLECGGQDYTVAGVSHVKYWNGVL